MLTVIDIPYLYIVYHYYLKLGKQQLTKACPHIIPSNIVIHLLWSIAYQYDNRLVVVCVEC